MRTLTVAFVFFSAVSFAHAGEAVTTKSQQSTQPAVTEVQPTQEAVVKAQPMTEPKSNALGKVGREGCGHGAQAKAPLLTQ